MTSRRHYIVAFLLGLIGFIGALASWQFQVGAFKLSFVWSYSFPLLASMAYGPRGALVSGLLALGAFFPFIVWPSNGYACFVTSFLLLGWFLWHAFSNRLYEKHGRWWLHPILQQIVYTGIYSGSTYLLFPVAFSMNPPPWNPQAELSIPSHILVSILAKGAPLMFLAMILARIFLFLPAVRSLMGLDRRMNSERNHLIFAVCVSSVGLFWLLQEMLQSSLVEGKFHIHSVLHPGSPGETLSLLVFVLFSLVVAHALTFLSERQLQALRTLHQSEQKLNLVLENVEAFVFIKDLEGRYLYANRKVASLFGTTPEGLIGKSDADFFDEKSVLEIRKSDEPVMAHGQRIERKERELEVPGTKNPRTYWTIKVPLRDARGNITGLCGISTDISQKEVLDQEREHLLEQLRQKNDELLRFNYTVSHDLRTPLINIRGFVKELSNDLESGSSSDVKRDLQFIDESAQRMGNLLKDLLDLSRIGKSSDTPKPIALQKLVQEVAQIFQMSFREHQASVQIDPDMPTIVTEYNRLFLVYQNLIDNSIRYRRKDLTLFIEIGARVQDHSVLCWVKDNGIGIPPEYHEKVFGLFEQLNRSPDSTGIGLTLVKKNIEILGGRIWIDSLGKGNGTTIYFTLPH